MAYHTRSRGRTDRKQVNRSLEVDGRCEGRELPVELLKFGLHHDPTVLREFHRVIKLVWHQRKVLQRWRDAVIKFLHKKDRTEYGNYRGISLITHASTVLLEIIATRLVGEGTAAGVPPAPFDDGYDAVRRLQEVGRKARVPLFLCCIDLQKAYGSVDRALLWQALARFGASPQIIEVIANSTMASELACGIMTADTRSSSKWDRGSVRDACFLRCCSSSSVLR